MHPSTCDPPQRSGIFCARTRHPADLREVRSYEADQVGTHVVRFDFEKDGTLHDRVWSIDGAKRTLMLDVHHKKLEPKKN